MESRIYHHPTKRDVDIPNVDLLTLLFDSDLTWSQEDTVLHFEAENPNNKLDKKSLRDLCQHIAYGLRQSYGIGAHGSGKDVVTVISYGQILVPAALYGVVAAGGVYSAASPSSTVEELVRQIQISKSRLLICGGEHRALALQAAQKCNFSPRNILLLDSSYRAWCLRSLDNTVDAIGIDKLSWGRITDRTALKESLIVILWSSGTTGLPKGVMLSHLNLVAETFIVTLSVRETITKAVKDGTFVPSENKPQTLAHLPISHIAGLFGYLIGPIFMGATIIWMRRYVWGDLLKYLQQYTITSFYTVPSIWLRISKSPEVSNHFRALEGASTGAAPMDGTLMQGINRRVGDGNRMVIGQTWGLSETTGAVTAMPATESDDTGSISPILPGVELRLVDEEYNDVDPATQEGELIVRSTLVTNGYFNNPRATADAFHGEWFCSGDIAVMRDGKFYIIDRKKELLKYKGLQVAPAEIENVLFHHARIQEAAVVGVPAPEDPGTDWPRAYVVKVDGAQLSESEVHQWVRDRLAPYKQLRGGVVFVSELPKNAIGKYLRRELRDRASKEVAVVRSSKL